MRSLHNRSPLPLKELFVFLHLSIRCFVHFPAIFWQILRVKPYFYVLTVIVHLKRFLLRSLWIRKLLSVSPLHSLKQWGQKELSFWNKYNWSSVVKLGPVVSGDLVLSTKTLVILVPTQWSPFTPQWVNILFPGLSNYRQEKMNVHFLLL